MGKLIACIIFGLAIGLVASLFTTPIFCFLGVIFYVPFARKKFLEKAKEDGHVIEAHLKKKHSLMPGDDNSTVTTPQEMGTYRSKTAYPFPALCNEDCRFFP